MSAHMGRQTAMGELTASLTHALAQPLAAILIVIDDVKDVKGQFSGLIQHETR
jgi:hypothetical protein